MTRATALVADAEELIRWSLGRRLGRAGYRVLEAGTAEEALQHAREVVDVVVLDDQLPDGDVPSVLRRLRELQPEAPVLVTTASARVEQAMEAVRGQAYDVVTKPFDVAALAARVERALDETRLRRHVRDLRARAARDGALEGMVGESAPMREVRALLAKYARSRSTVLVTGESGTGKDMAARAIHAESERAGEPFMNITCSALPENLLESELFGHERGAFTDAKQQKKGLLEQAHRGTVFLDEIAEMTPRLQAKLLRFLSDGAFRRVGGSAEIRPDVRVVAATNRDLRDAVARGAFREDLLYRLSVLHVHMPPLRERGADVELLVEYFVERFDRDRRRVRRIAPAAMRLVRAHPWPGNVRELKNVLERAVLLCDGDEIGPEAFQDMHGPGLGGEPDRPFRLPSGGIDLAELERDLVVQALERTGGESDPRGRAAGPEPGPNSLPHRKVPFTWQG